MLIIMKMRVKNHITPQALILKDSLVINQPMLVDEWTITPNH